MTEHELLKSIEGKRSPEHMFIRYSRKENDFVDYELLSRFTENISDMDNVATVELLTMDDMWHQLKRLCGDKLSQSGTSVTWIHKGKNGVTEQTCPYTPESLINILDIETRGNPLD